VKSQGDQETSQNFLGTLFVKHNPIVGEMIYPSRRSEQFGRRSTKLWKSLAMLGVSVTGCDTVAQVEADVFVLTYGSSSRSTVSFVSNRKRLYEIHANL
jgi:hypothetical protein